MLLIFSRAFWRNKKCECVLTDSEWTTACLNAARCSSGSWKGKICQSRTCKWFYSLLVWHTLNEAIHVYLKINKETESRISKKIGAVPNIFGSLTFQSKSRKKHLSIFTLNSFTSERFCGWVLFGTTVQNFKGPFNKP